MNCATELFNIGLSVEEEQLRQVLCANTKSSAGFPIRKGAADEGLGDDEEVICIQIGWVVAGFWTGSGICYLLTERSNNRKGRRVKK